MRATLERVLASPAFRNSKQCQKFLRHVVEHSLAGEDDRLKERSLGIDVFGREPDYDTAADPVVRVRATEVRKRLGQYYTESGAEDDIRLEIPSGSYRAEFHAPVTRPTARPGGRWRFLPAFAAAIVCVGLGSYLLLRQTPQSAVDRFWAPVLTSPKPVLIYCGQPVVYFLSSEVHQRFRRTVPPESLRGSYRLDLKPGDTLRGSDVIPVTDQFVGIGNAHTAALLSALFASRGKGVEIRYANDLSFSDLRSAPSVLVGAFSNLWTLEMTSQLRFVFEQHDGVRRIRDRSANRTWQLKDLAPDGKTPDDYAVVSRLFDSATGQLLMTAAGITQYGTRAAGEFLTDPQRLGAALESAPADWPEKNVQVLLQTSVFRGTPAPPKVLALHVW